MAKTQARKRKAEAGGDAGINTCFSFPKPFINFHKQKFMKRFFGVATPSKKAQSQLRTH